MANNNLNKNNSFLSFFKKMLASVLFGTIISFLLLALLSFLIINLEKYETFYPILSVIIQMLPPFLSGKSLGKIYGHPLLLIGFFSGALMLLLYLSVSLILYGLDFNNSAFLTSIPYIIAASILGSITSGKSKKKVKY